ncbi:MAG TPA: sulfate adenylyltransferase subunit CysN [Candidatus Acidoferrales bacterium]|jgi:sulfate adenylyltransferase large subunit|nr:sulfate adenylyltransferase subunit CysN [Candidatus Acidoferrales bacterium]
MATPAAEPVPDSMPEQPTQSMGTSAADSPMQTAPQVLAPTGGLLRFSTAGSVDDGKSTLIGRLLYDSQAVFEDQLAAVRKSKVNRSGGPIDFSLLTDGLRAEREQGITIDVAYRYFSTPRRKFIIADTPGHEQYTRNMATGASTADASVVLMDATKGVLRQSRRHAFIASLLGVQHIVAAVNKMDLVGFSQEVFERIAEEFREFAEQLGVKSLYAVPVSALEGDNVVRKSLRTPWFEGPALLEHLENLKVNDAAADGPLRFPVQYVIRPDATFRGFAGQVASGLLRPGATVVALPSGLKTKVKSLVSFDEELEEAKPGASVNVTLEDEIDISRGDVLVDDEKRPFSGTEFQATVVWMHADPLDLHKIYFLKHTTRTVRARVKQIRQRIDVNTLEKSAATSLDMNDIAEVDIKTTLPLFFDPYGVNRTMGSFILIDQHTNSTVAAGIIQQPITSPATARITASVSTGRSTREERLLRFGHPSGAVWLQGRPRVAEMLERRLFEEGWFVQLVGPMDFLAHELITVTKACRLSGAITLFSPLEDGTDQAQAVRAIFGRDSFFLLKRPDLNDEETVAQLMEILYKWRDTHSDTKQRRK